MKLFKKIFKKNDWQIIQIASSEYKVWTETYGYQTSSVTVETAIVELWYSAVRNKYKIKFKGYIPINKEASKAYMECMRAQQTHQFNNQQNGLKKLKSCLQCFL